MPDSGRKSADAPLHANAINAIFAALREHGGLPSLGALLGRLTRMLESDTEGVQDLANLILSDVALTQRLLHVANTLPYRVGVPPVTTITRAIMLLGFNQIRAAAVSLVLLDGLAGAARSRAVREDFFRALLAGNLARELLFGVFGDEAEEASIAAMFRNVGRLLIGSFAPQAYEAVMQAMTAQPLSESAAARRVLGRSFEDIAHQVMQQWSVPERIAAATQPAPPRIGSAASGADRVRLAAQFSDEIAGALHGAASAGAADAALAAALARFAPAFALDRPQLTTLIDRAQARTRDMAQSCGLAPTEIAAPNVLDALPEASQLMPEPVQPQSERDAVGRPANARAVLLAGLSEATDALARAAEGAVDVNTVIRIVLEAMYSGLGYAHAAFFLRDAAANLFRVRASFGEPALKFAFPAHYTADIVHAALAHATDLHIADVAAEKVAAKLPAWFARELPQTRSFVLMPLVLKDKPLGLFFAGRTVADTQGLAPEELNLLRSLRNQVVLALRSR
jgi:HD-like signal output (HDOD) protein